MGHQQHRNWSTDGVAWNLCARCDDGHHLWRNRLVVGIDDRFCGDRHRMLHDLFAVWSIERCPVPRSRRCDWQVNTCGYGRCRTVRTDFGGRGQYCDGVGFRFFCRNTARLADHEYSIATVRRDTLDAGWIAVIGTNPVRVHHVNLSKQ